MYVIISLTKRGGGIDSTTDTPNMTTSGPMSSLDGSFILIKRRPGAPNAAFIVLNSDKCG